MDFKDELISTLSSPTSGIFSPQFDLEKTPSGRVGGFIVSPTFEGMSQFDRQHLVWDYLDKVFGPDRLTNIVTLVTVTPDEAETD